MNSKQLPNLQVLADFLECEPDDINLDIDAVEGEPFEFEYDGRDYWVLTDEQADLKCRERILDSMWAFNASWVVRYIDGYNTWDQKQTDAIVQGIQSVQEKLCEDANNFMRALIGDKMHRFVNDAIEADGRGHFLATYDGEENEAGDYFIYRF